MIRNDIINFCKITLYVLDYMCTTHDLEIIEYMKASPEKKVLVNIDDAWVNRDDMGCLLQDGIFVNGAVSIDFIYIFVYRKVYIYSLIAFYTEKKTY